MKNLLIDSAHTVPRKRWASIVCAAASLILLGLLATPALAQFAYTPYDPQVPVFQDTLWVVKGAVAGGDGSQQLPFGSIQEACDTINNRFGVEAYLVLVGPGIYAENIDMPNYTTTWIKSLNGPNTTRITGDPKEGYKGVLNYHSFTDAQLFSGIQGFTIADHVVDDCDGGCDGAITLDAYYGIDQFFILDNWILNNFANFGAGAIAVGYGVEAFIIGNHIIGNTSNSIYFYDHPAGAIYYDGAYGVISNNVFARNHGAMSGGLFTWSNTEVRVLGNTFVGNTFSGGSEGAGAIFVSDNIPGARGAAKVSGQQTSFGWFANNIVAFNDGPAMDADYFVQDGPISCLFYGNDGDDFTGSYDVGFNNLFGADPLFVDPENDDYHITCDSPAREAGGNDYVPLDFLSAYDIDGPPQTRVGPNVLGHYFGSSQIVDIGADEFNDTQKIAAFSTADTVGCAPFTVHFTNESQCIDEIYAWNFGDDPAGAYDSIDAVHVYDTAGLYTVQLRSIGYYDTVQVTHTVRVLEPITLDFAGEPLSGCGSLLTTFTATADADSFQWVFGDGDTADTDVNVVEHEYTLSGVFSVILRAFNACGVTEVVKEDYVTTLSNAEAAIFSDFNPEAPPCVPADVTFGYESNQELTNILWLFGDGRSSTEANPTHTYTDFGTFTVTLTATSDCGDVEVVEPNFVTILGPPSVEVNITPTSACVGSDEVEFSAVFEGQLDSSRWNFDDGVNAPGPAATHTYADPGEYNPFLVVFHQCGQDTFELSTPIVVSPVPVADFSAEPTTLYETEVAEFTDMSENANSYAWSFGDGGTSTQQNPAHEYAPGIYTVALEITNGCGSDTETKNNYISVGSFAVTCDSTGKAGDTLLYTIDVDTVVIGYDHTVVLSAQLLGAPARGTVEFSFGQTSGTPPFTTTLRAFPKGGLSSGSYTIRVTADDALRMAKTDMCSLNYTATQIIQVSGAAVDFGEVIINTSDDRTFTVTNNASAASEAALEVNPPTVTGAGFSVTGDGDVLQPGESVEWTLTFMPTTVQPFEGVLHVNSDDPIMPLINIPLTGDGIPVPDLTPPCVASTNPEDGTEIAIDSVIRITFTEGMVEQDFGMIVSSASKGFISGTTVWESTRRVRFAPDNFLPTESDFFPPDDDLTITILGAVTDSAGNTLDGDCNGTAEGSTADDFTFQCTTGPGVFPGDTDDDGFVNEGDIIPIGRFWMLTGPPRTNPQEGFTIQPATAWNPRAATYADADGDGIVDSLDICPVLEFFDLAQPGALARVAVQSWLDEAQGWSGDVVSALLAALDICDNQGAGSAAVRQFLTSLQTSNNDPVPNRYSLDQNYPNPFNPTTIIAYTLKEDAPVRIEVFDIQGHRVRVLEDKFQTAGRHNLIWDGLNADGVPVASGVYFYRMTTPDFSFSRKMVLVR